MASKPRISLKLSAKSLDPDTNAQPAKSEPTSRKRAKRLVLSDDESGDQDQDPATPSSPPQSSTRRSHTLAEDSGSELTEPEPEPEPEASPLSQPSSSSHLKRSKGRKRTDGPPAKKKRIQQDVSSDEEYHVAAPFGDDDDHIIHTKRQSKLTAKAKATKGKSKLFTVGARDERNAGRTQQSNSTEADRKAKTKRPRESKAEDDPVDVVNDTETRPDTRSLSPPQELVAPPPKRRKFPTIKKNKGPGATSDPAPSSMTTSSNAVTKSTVPKAPDLPKPTLAGSRVPPMMVGNTDFDLRDESVYKALFNQSGGNTQGLTRQKKEEERRKELNKMRDEAKAKRLSEMTPSFDLQAQYEKIKRFEESLGRRCLFPNVLASKWRDIHEAERRKAFMEQTWSPGRNDQEEGQVRAHPELES